MLGDEVSLLFATSSPISSVDHFSKILILMCMFRRFIRLMLETEQDVQPLRVCLLEEKSTEWNLILRRFPTELQAEIEDERSGSPSDIEELSNWRMGNPPLVIVQLRDLLRRRDTLDSIARCPPQVIEKINNVWNLDVKHGQSYDRDPGRYERYAQMDAGTAKPSIMLDGEIIWGVGRMIAALMRGGRTIRAWNILSR